MYVFFVFLFTFHFFFQNDFFLFLFCIAGFSFVELSAELENILFALFESSVLNLFQSEKCTI